MVEKDANFMKIAAGADGTRSSQFGLLSGSENAKTKLKVYIHLVHAYPSVQHPARK